MNRLDLIAESIITSFGIETSVKKVFHHENQHSLHVTMLSNCQTEICPRRGSRTVREQHQIIKALESDSGNFFAEQNNAASPSPEPVPVVLSESNKSTFLTSVSRNSRFQLFVEPGKDSQGIARGFGLCLHSTTCSSSCLIRAPLSKASVNCTGVRGLRRTSALSQGPLLESALLRTSNQVCFAGTTS